MSDITTLQLCKEFLENNYSDYISIRHLLESVEKHLKRVEELLVLAETDPPDYTWGLQLLKEQGVYLTFAQWAKNKLEGEDE